jgi:hypothetical protein
MIIFLVHIIIRRKARKQPSCVSLGQKEGMGDYVDDMMLATLISMGFEEPIARQALVVSGNSSVDTALGATSPSLGVGGWW